MFAEIGWLILGVIIGNGTMYGYFWLKTHIKIE